MRKPILLIALFATGAVVAGTAKPAHAQVVFSFGTGGYPYSYPGYGIYAPGYNYGGLGYNYGTFPRYGYNSYYAPRYGNTGGYRYYNNSNWNNNYNRGYYNRGYYNGRRGR